MNEQTTIIPRAVVTAVAIALATGASAQPALTDPAEASSFGLPSGSVPAEIFGIPCESRAGDAKFSPMLTCRVENPTKKPSISVVVAPSTCDKTSQQMASEKRTQFNDGTPFFNVVWEQDFTPPSMPDAVGFRAFYQKSMGNRYFWAVCGQGKITSVLAIMFAPTDNEALKAEIESKVFGINRVQSRDAKGSNQ